MSSGYLHKFTSLNELHSERPLTSRVWSRSSISHIYLGQRLEEFRSIAEARLHLLYKWKTLIPFLSTRLISQPIRVSKKLPATHILAEAGEKGQENILSIRFLGEDTFLDAFFSPDGSSWLLERTLSRKLLNRRRFPVVVVVVVAERRRE